MARDAGFVAPAAVFAKFFFESSGRGDEEFDDVLDLDVLDVG